MICSTYLFFFKLALVFKSAFVYKVRVRLLACVWLVGYGMEWVGSIPFFKLFG